ncbi:FHA domain-containing protein [Vitiosangium sp. GDMCC 1.1324]|uniref:FHA domain-containing protein n=1 Tax=Vitiosangium sp. (strain GDMCC 1.1324) TaxID=2138576 RepID=UPI000D3711AC|nr:FHA domain-containing protein [Vitiosangium sp. GDMCC 1.1324]PTL76315.1 FHA domain-containing protein [Vitiosangium sp. GDMCC 1.1324]
MPTLVVRHPDGSESEHEFSSELKVGRQEGTNDLVLAEGGVSRRHSRFVVESGKVMVEDVGSANGTFVDGQRITGMTPLTPKSQVQLGDYELRLKASAPRAATGGQRAVGDSPPRATRAMPAVKRPAPGAGGPSALAKRPRPASPAGAAEDGEGGGLILKGLTGPWANQKFPVKGKLIVGRQAPASVVLDDDSVSRKHAEVEATPDGGALLRDLGSANGTLVNGEPMGTQQVELQPGDVITFGMVEVLVESAGGGANLPARRGRSEVPSRRGAGGAAAEADEAPAAGGAPASRKRLMMVVAASVVGLLLVAGIVKSTLGSGRTKGPAGGGAVQAQKGAPPPNPAEQVQEFLSQCRSYSSMEMGSEPDWGRAETACSKALDVDPINAEANSLMRRIKLEKEAADYFSQGLKALGRLKEEDALDLFKKIPKDSAYFRRAKPKVQEAVAQVMKRSEDDCKRYLRDDQWSAAVPRCTLYMGFACQKMSREDLEPPIGFTLVLDRKKRLGRTEWRPKDKLYLDFLIARKKLDPNAAPWRCPVSDIFFEDEAAPDPKKQVEEVFKQRFPQKLMVAAMMDYWAGRGNEAVITLQKLRSNYELAQYHGDADKMLQDVGNVDQLFKIGQGHLQNEDVEKAADPLLEALEVDKRLMGDLVDSRPSFYRRNIHQDMAAKAITRGKYWDERGDQRRACRIWKLGFQFYAGNTDLNSQVGRCSTRGLKAFKSAQACEDLDAVLDFAVKGDGLEEKVLAMKKENGC